MMPQMSTQARELTVSAYRAGEMDFPIGVAAAELAAAHAGQPDRLLATGKAVAAAVYAEADEDTDEEELIDEYEELIKVPGVEPTAAGTAVCVGTTPSAKPTESRPPEPDRLSCWVCGTPSCAVIGRWVGQCGLVGFPETPADQGPRGSLQ